MTQQSLIPHKLAMANQHLADGNYREAARLYRQVLSIEPDNIEANYAVACRLLAVKRDGLAKEYLQKVIAKEPKHFQAILQLMKIAFDYGDQDKQSTLLQELIENASEAGQLLQLSHAMRYMSMTEHAIKVIEKCLAIDPGLYDAHITMATSYRELGEFKLAERHIRDAIYINPDRLEAYALLTQLDTLDYDEPEFAAMENLYRNENSLDDNSRIMLHYSLGRIMDRRGKTEQAFKHYLEANKTQSSISHYSPEGNHQRFRAIQAAFSKEFFLSNPRVGSESTCPIFIVGMPRSGTSLVEQILSSHPVVFGAGELDDFDAFAHRLEVIRSKPFFEEIEDLDPTVFERFAMRYLSKIRALSKGAQHVTDKMPQNFRYIGLIKLVFPYAKIVHCRRNPIDTCLSIFTNTFGGAHPYSHNLLNLGRYYADYAKMMLHWHAALPFSIYDVEYEELVADKENEIRALLNFCSLPFHENCMEFYKTNRVVATASANQVRRPMYRDSIQTWTRYRKELAPLVGILNREGVIDNSGALE